MPLPAVMMIAEPGIPRRLVGANSASCPAVISPACTPDDPPSVILPVVAVNVRTLELMVKPRSIVRLRPAFSVSWNKTLFSALVVPNEVATKISLVVLSVTSAAWPFRIAVLSQDTVDPSGAWVGPMVGRSPGRTV